MDGIQTHMVGSGPVKWDFVQHPPAPEPTISSSLKGLGSAYGNLGRTQQISWGRMTPTLVVTAMTAYAGYISPKKEAKKLFGLAAGTLALGSLWSLS